MTSTVEIDVSANTCWYCILVKVSIALVLATAVVISAAGMLAKQPTIDRENTSVSWHNVSDALKQVEHAKSDLFDALRHKSP